MITVLIAAALLAGPKHVAQVPAAGIPYCAHEDGSGQNFCLWDAKIQGNGVGCTYVVLNGHRLPLVAVGTGKDRSPRYHGPECLAMR